MTGCTQEVFSQRRFSSTVQGPPANRNLASKRTSTAKSPCMGSHQDSDERNRSMISSHSGHLTDWSKEGQQGLREVAVARESLSNRATELPFRDSPPPSSPQSARANKEGAGVGDMICSHSVHLKDWSRGYKIRWIVGTSLAHMHRVDSTDSTSLWGSGLLLGTHDYLAQNETPSSWKDRKEKKSEPSPPLSTFRILEDGHNLLGRFTVNGRLYFFFQE